jgi:hypothetical protein
MTPVGPKTPFISSPEKRSKSTAQRLPERSPSPTTRPTSADRNEQQLQQIWDSIAFHATPSLALHGQPIVNVVSWGVTADIHYSNTPGGVVTIDGYKEVIKAYPRIGLMEQTTETPCGLCKTKPETTYDNFVGSFDRSHIDGYNGEWEKWRMDEYLVAAVKACEKYEN